MKTTVEVNDGLFQAVKNAASRQGVTFREAVECGLRRWLEERTAARPFTLRTRPFQGDGMVRDFSWDEIRDMIYQDRD